MKSLLEFIQSLQEERIKQLEQKKPVMALSKVAGAMLPGNTLSQDYQQIIKTVDQFQSTRKRYKGDSSNKIVLEKNLALRVFKQIGGYFFLRSIYNNEYINIPLSKKIENAVIGPPFPVVLMFLISIISIIMLALALLNTPEQKMAPHYENMLIVMSLLGVFAIVSGVYCLITMMWKRKIQRKIGKDPKHIIASHISNHIEQKDKKHKISLTRIKLKIDLWEKVREWYLLVFSALFSIEKKTENQIGWLWRYTTSGYYFDIYNKIISLEPCQDVIPLLETETAFIFHFPPLEDKSLYDLDFFKNINEKSKIEHLFETENEKLFLPFKEA